MFKIKGTQSRISNSITELFRLCQWSLRIQITPEKYVNFRNDRGLDLEFKATTLIKSSLGCDTHVNF